MRRELVKYLVSGTAVFVVLSGLLMGAFAGAHVAIHAALISIGLAVPIMIVGVFGRKSGPKTLMVGSVLLVAGAMIAATACTALVSATAILIIAYNLNIGGLAILMTLWVVSSVGTIVSTWIALTFASATVDGILTSH